MPKIYEKNGKIFMDVTPASFMVRNSGFIKDIVTTGRKFVVDLNTGELTLGFSETVFSKPKEVNVYWWRGKGVGSRKLSKEIDVALVQIADEWATGYKKGRLYVNGQCKVRNDDPLSWNAVVEQIRDVYDTF